MVASGSVVKVTAWVAALYSSWGAAKSVNWIYSHRDLRGSSFLHRPGQVFSVCQKCLIIGPFVRRGQVPGGAVRLPGVLKASGVAAGEHRETGPPLSTVTAAFSSGKSSQLVETG